MKRCGSAYYRIILPLIIAILLTGCNKSNSKEVTENIYETVTNVYRTVDINLPEGLGYDYIFIAGDRIYVIGNSEKTGQVFISFDYNGENIEVKPIPKPAGVSGSYYVNAAGIMSDASYIIVTNRILYRLAADGSIMFNTDIADVTYGTEVFISEDGRIYLYNDRAITVYDSSLNALYTAGSDAEPYLSGFVCNSEGNIVIHCYRDARTYYRLNDEKQSLEPYDTIEIPVNIDEYPDIYFGGGYDTYFSDINGFYGCNSGEKEAKLLLDWANSDILRDNIEITAVLTEDCILAETQDSFSAEKKPVLLKRIPDSEVTPKIPVILALLGADEYDFLREAAALYNQTNHTYRIVFENYYANVQFAAEQAVEQFNKDILQGIIPDIVLVSDYLLKSIDNYTSKGFFTGINEYIDGNGSGGNLLGCVRSSIEKEGEIYHIPVFMQLKTLAAKSEMTGNSQSLTPEQLYGLADDMPDGASLFSDINREDILQTAMFDFVDFENKTCDFDSEGFIRLLNFTADISGYTDTEKGKLIENDYISPTLTGSLAGNSLYFLNLPINNINAFAIAKYCFGGESYALKGFPTESGNGSMIHYDYTLGITEQSQKKQGAWDFIEFLLSDKIQTSEKLVSGDLPVTISAIEKLMEYSHYYMSVEPYSDDNIKNAGKFDIYVKSVDELPDDHPFVEIAQYHITLSDSERYEILNFFNKTVIKSRQNEKITEIVMDETGAFYAGDVSAGNAARYIQNRVYTYINE